MKIAIDIRSAGGEKAGKGWYTFYLVHSLLKLDHQNEYILYAKSGVPGFEEFKNARVKLISGPSIFWHFNVIHDLKREGIDLFFAPSSYIIPSMLPRKIKSITAVHDLVAFLFPQTHNKKAVFLEKFFLRKALKRTSQVITASEHTRKDLLRIFSKFAPPKATTIYCGSGEHFKPTPKDSLKKFAQQTNLPKKFFLAVGTLEPRKNYPRLIQAFARLHKIHPEYHLIIVGKPGWNYQEIHDSVKENFLQKRVHFLGYLSNKSLNNLYNLATALAFPSLYEGFGIPPLEAMRCGCPVITSNTSSLPEVTGDAALKVDPKSSEQIFLALRTIIEDPETAEKLKSAGLNQSQKFSWDLSAQKLYNLLTQLEK